MTIELITGSPGAGKTAYAVGVRLVQECGRKVKVETSPGFEEEIMRRVIVGGIRGLALPHERIPHTLTGERLDQAHIDHWNQVDANGQAVHVRLPGQPAQEVEASLFNWWMWCKPGDLIVVDEVQYIAPRGTMNKKAPPWVQLLETHRHYGVDFLFITQHPDFLDPHIRKLVNPHRHVRATMGWSLCMVYTWDYASNPERYNMAAKSAWKRGRKHYRLYKSSVGHVAPPAGGRSSLVIAPLLLLVFVGGGYSWAKHRFGAGETPAAGSAQSLQAPGRAASASLAVHVSADPRRIAGCWTIGDECRCFFEDGRPAYIDLKVCRISASSFEGAIAWQPRKVPEVSTASAAASSPVQEFMAGR